ncbi:hypothetical protein B0H66DRAFT_336669 [Apodospora peruviana]|uniref:Uncharacterized protein n=1 Tax=Apodospora peruviana TaxID=516989 RepID=A0AAE0HYH6_9PEZI|nr:hypothetical protein B0H66DRAFT_336669 [Apodospora peruviana]
MRQPFKASCSVAVSVRASATWTGTQSDNSFDRSSSRSSSGPSRRTSSSHGSYLGGRNAVWHGPLSFQWPFQSSNKSSSPQRTCPARSLDMEAGIKATAIASRVPRATACCSGTYWAPCAVLPSATPFYILRCTALDVILKSLPSSKVACSHDVGLGALNKHIEKHPYLAFPPNGAKASSQCIHRIARTWLGERGTQR